ncbi:MAG: hypothetical protein HYX74_10915 [Acidobacteria bacterium]|nr:hypothetical protein [Acidobacteriota bacterium]
MHTAVADARHCAAIIGGAVAGSTAAEILADAGVLCVVFEQNDRPYGKIEDGLPRWHVKQRKMEYQTIDARLDQPTVLFVPRTRLGTDIRFSELISDWGFSVVLLANGAWKDRPLPIEGIDRYVDKGLVYQNPFIYWFNHKNEKGYSGPRYSVPPGTIVIGGGLASIDVVKAVQVQVYEAALRARGVQTSMLELEQKGIPAVCAGHGLDPEGLGVKDCELFYRRRAADMPLATMPDNPAPAQIAKTEMVRQKILGKVLEKYRVRFHECHLPLAPLLDGDRLVGLRFVRTHVEGRQARPIAGSEKDIYAPLVISSIGSVPEPIPGIEMKGDFYCFKNWDTGQYEPAPQVFGVGNVVTGQGNIAISQKHAAHVATHILENYFGVGNGSRDISAIYEAAEERTGEQMEHVLDFLHRQPLLSPEQANRIVQRVQRRMREIGYLSYRRWIESVTPTDLE